MGKCFFHLIDQHQAQVSGLQAREGRVDGDELAADLFYVAGARGPGQSLAQQGHDLAVGPAALGGILVQDHIVERCAQDHGLLADVLVTPVTRLLMTFPGA